MSSASLTSHPCVLYGSQYLSALCPSEKKAANQLSDVEEERPDAEMDSDEVEGEKENVSNVGTTPAADATTPKRKRKRKDGGESSPKKAMYRKKKKSSNLITSDQGAVEPP